MYRNINRFSVSSFFENLTAAAVNGFLPGSEWLPAQFCPLYIAVRDF